MPTRRNRVFLGGGEDEGDDEGGDEGDDKGDLGRGGIVGMLPENEDDNECNPASFNKASRFKKELAISRSLVLSPFRMGTSLPLNHGLVASNPRQDRVWIEHLDATHDAPGKCVGNVPAESFDHVGLRIIQHGSQFVDGHRLLVDIVQEAKEREKGAPGNAR